MKKNLFYHLMCLLWNIPVFSQQIQGVIYYQNSGGKTATGVEISAFGCDGVYTKANGVFILNCPGKQVGQKVKLILGNKDAQGKNIEVVNTKQLEWLRIPNNPSDDPIEIIICYAGQRDNAALRFYGILAEASNKEYEARLVNIEDELKKTTLDASERRILIEQIDILRKQRDEAFTKLEEQAQFIASINQDKASDLVKSSIQKVEQEEDINSALAILDNVKLEEAYQLAFEKKVKAETEIKQVIEGYEMKIALLIPKFRYREATLCYERIINIYESNNFDKVKLVNLYQIAANIISDDGLYKKALEYRLKANTLAEGNIDSKDSLLAVLYSNIGCSYEKLGQYEKALEYHLKCITIEEEILSPQDQSLAISYSNISTAYEELGQYKKALEYQQKSILIKEEILSPQDRSLAISYSNISTAYEGLGQYKKALEYQQKAIAIQEEILEKKHPDLAISYGNIGNYYKKLGQFKTALEYTQKSINIQEEILDSKHPILAVSYNNISLIYTKIKQHEKALEYQQKAINIQEEVLDPKHPDLAALYNNIALVYNEIGQHEKALEYQQKAINIQEEVLDPKHPDLAASYSGIGDIYRELEQNEKALEYQQKAINIQEEVLDPKHPDLAVLYNNIALVYNEIGQHEKALGYQQKAINIQEEVLDPKHPDLVDIFSSVSFTYLRLEQYDKALEYQQKALTIQEEILGLKHSDLGIIYSNIAIIYKGMKKFEKSIEMQEKCMNLFKITLPENHPFQQIAFNIWLEIYFEKAIDAFEMKEYTVALLDFHTIENYINDSEFWNTIGLCHYYLSNYTKAIEAYQKAGEVSSETIHVNLLNNIGMAYAKNKQYQESHTYFSEYEKLQPNEGRVFRNWAMYYALQGDKENALKNLEKAVFLGYKDLEWLKTDDSLNSLRKEKAFKKVMQKLEKSIKKE